MKSQRWLHLALTNLAVTFYFVEIPEKLFALVEWIRPAFHRVGAFSTRIPKVTVHTAAFYLDEIRWHGPLEV